MQTQLDKKILETPQGKEAERILRNCVHCGFCNATCPTYQLLGNELDGPRGRIYLMKQMLEGQAVSAHTQLHLDRCLTCRNCETTCPSGVEYGRLLEVGRELVEHKVARPWPQRLLRGALLRVLPYRRRFGVLLALGRIVRPLLPAALRASIPLRREIHAPAPSTHRRTVLLLEGCVQPALAPSINAATVAVLDRLGLAVERPQGGGCCGAIHLHMADEHNAQDFMRRNIDAWWPAVEAGAEAIVINASGCGVTVKDYGRLLAHDPAYADKARRISELARDLGEVVAAEDLGPLNSAAGGRKIAFHPPCTLQHGMRLRDSTEDLLQRLGFELLSVPDAHLCCGAAGTYTLLQPEISRELGDRKVAALQTNGPEAIASANIGCLLEIEKRAGVPVRHWVELVAEGLERRG